MTKDVKKPFYYIVGWSDEDQYYIGSRYKKGCCTSDLGTTYFTSSKIVQAKWKQKAPDIIRVLMTFDTAAQAREWEATALENLGVPKCRFFLNKAAGNKKFYVEDTPEARAKHAAVMKKASSRPEVKAKKSASQKAAQNRPEVRAKQLASLKETNKKPEIKAKKSAVSKEAQNRPEVRAKKSASQKAAQNRPEVKAKQSASQKAAHARPEVRAKHCKRMQTPDGVFDSLKAASQHYRISSPSLIDRMKRYPSAYYYI